MKTRVLAADDTRSLVRQVGLDALMDQLIQHLEDAIRGYDPAQTDIPVRAGFDYELPVPGLLEWMPARSASEVTMKIVSYHATNPATRGLPTVISTISTYEVGTGHLLGIVDGTLLTALRTGAASALASRELAAQDSRTLGLIGCGAQAVTQLHAISRLFPVDKVLVYDSNPDFSASFSGRIAFMNLDVEVAAVDRVAGEVDILCTATSVNPGAGPVLQDQVTQPWLHINAVGSDFPGKLELPVSLLRRAFVTTDFLEQAMQEGECQQLASNEIGPSLAELIRSPERYRDVRQQLSVFDSTGWALEDQVVMDLFMHHACDLGLGAEIEIEHVSADPRDPYQNLSGSIVRREFAAGRAGPREVQSRLEAANSLCAADSPERATLKMAPAAP